jgi:hypothetical protein
MGHRQEVAVPAGARLQRLERRPAERFARGLDDLDLDGLGLSGRDLDGFGLEGLSAGGRWTGRAGGMPSVPT